jgi:type IV fimbrial biogenesis protein FimT
MTNQGPVTKTEYNLNHRSTTQAKGFHLTTSKGIVATGEAMATSAGRFHPGFNLKESTPAAACALASTIMEMKMAKNPEQTRAGQMRGFTLLELLITLAVAAILLSIAVPSFSTAIQNNRMTTQINELNSALSLGRSEAVKRNNPITICQSSNGTSCTGDWEDGWIVFVDPNADGVVADPVDIVSVHGALPANINIAFSADRVIYTGAGLATDGASNTFTICDEVEKAKPRRLALGPTGRPTLVVAEGDVDWCS